MLPGVGVFGTSLTARVIIPLLKDEGFAVKALWGRTQEEAEELAKEMSVPFYTSRIDEVLLHQDVDLVCINLPPPLTRQIAVKTLGDITLGFLCAPWMPLPPLERPNGGPSEERACLLSWQPWPSPQTASPWGFSAQADSLTIQDQRVCGGADAEST
uniref:Gfo/Idh/MocA-like oxidoreductase domain containing 1 n=1 Tax=Lynx canadensis TaxID=61383 RepID=A0A667I842_LYNCA